MATKRKMPTHRAIRVHWAERLTQMQRADSLEDVLDCDWCFACGFSLPMKTERAHILAWCDGGSHDLENLHLLCPPCHIASEPLSGADYWTWFAERTPLDAIEQIARGRDYSDDYRRVVSERSKAALGELKRQGVKLGRPAGSLDSSPETVALIKELRAERRSYRAIAAELDRRGVAAPRGRGWNQESVRRAHLSD